MFRAKNAKVAKENVQIVSVLGVLCASIFFLFISVAQADEITDALDASAQAQRAARESQARVNKLDDETRALGEKQQGVRWRALQMSAYAAQLELEAEAEERKRAGLETQIARIKDTETELLPLMRRMVAELDDFIARDLPFLREVRRQRMAELKVVLDDPERGIAEKYRRVLETQRTEVNYGYSLGAEDTEIETGGRREPVSLVRVGRVGLYYLSPDQTRAGYWSTEKRGWRPLDTEAVEGVRHALNVARGDVPPELLVLPVQVAR